MKLIKFLSILVISLSVQVLSAQSAPAEKVKTASVASSKNKQTRAEFNESIFKLYKAHKLEMKDMQIQFINKEFQLDLENEKSMLELKNKFNPTAGPEKNKEVMSLIENKSKEFQAKRKQKNDEFYSKKMAEKGKAYYEMVSQRSKEFEATQAPTQPQGQKPAPPRK